MIEHDPTICNSNGLQNLFLCAALETKFKEKRQIILVILFSTLAREDLQKAVANCQPSKP